MSVVVGFMVLVALQSSFTLWRIGWRNNTCRRCVPRCPSGHASERAGTQGMFITAVIALAGAALGALL